MSQCDINYFNSHHLKIKLRPEFFVPPTKLKFDSNDKCLLYYYKSKVKEFNLLFKDYRLI